VSLCQSLRDDGSCCSTVRSCGAVESLGALRYLNLHLRRCFVVLLADVVALHPLCWACGSGLGGADDHLVGFGIQIERLPVFSANWCTGGAGLDVIWLLAVGASFAVGGALTALRVRSSTLVARVVVGRVVVAILLV